MIAAGPATGPRRSQALLRPAAKCLVLDLDNTLWGGVLGDDGPQGIKLGDDYPGNVFKDFQAALLGLRRARLPVGHRQQERRADRARRARLASRNAAQARALRQHSRQLGSPSRPTCARSPQTLNIGLDSLVFIDDNPVERAAVRAELPMVHVVELPADPLGYLAALREVAAVRSPATARTRTASGPRCTRANRCASRSNSRPRASKSFCRDLEMTAQVGRCDANTLGADSSAHSKDQPVQSHDAAPQHRRPAPIHGLAATRPSPGCGWPIATAIRAWCAWASCERLDDDTWEIDTLLMSCRVMGRQVEDAFLVLPGRAGPQRGARRLRGSFPPHRQEQSRARLLRRSTASPSLGGQRRSGAVTRSN